MSYRRKSDFLTRDEIKKDRQKAYAVLKKYKLSLAELALLEKELVQATQYCDAERIKLEQEISSLDTQQQNIRATFPDMSDPERDPVLRELHEAERYARDHDGILGKTIFRRDREYSQARLIEAKRKWDSVCQRERARECEVNNRLLNPLEDKKQTIKRIIWEARWWEQANFSLLSRSESFRGSDKILAEEIMGVGYLSAKYRSGRAIEALEQLRKDQEKKEELEVLRARAAISDAEARQLAIAIKKQLTSQVRILRECPYCGDELQLGGAHADHIYPLSKGGHSTKRNMVYVCDKCNMKKANLTLSHFIRKMGYDREAIESRLDLLKKDY